MPMKRMIFCLVLTAAVMLVLPWLAVTFVPLSSGMAAMMFLFFVVDPICAVVVGAVAGTDIKRMKLLPLIFALLFIAGCWCFLDFGDPDFFVYAIPYLVLGYGAMYGTHWLRKRKQK